MIETLRKKWLALAILAVAITVTSCSLSEPAETSPAKPEKVTKSSGYPPAPRALANAKIRTLDGEDFKIADLKGKVVLINLWATWCGPCIVEMPHFVKLQEKYGDSGFVMIGLNSDEESEEQVRAFVEKQGLNYTIGWTTKEVIGEFFKISKLPGIPQSLLLNRNGEMTGMFRGGSPDVIESMEEAVEKRMAE